MTDFETLLAERFNDLVDHETGAPASALPFVPTDEPESDDDRRPSWTRWLLVAAVIAVVAGLTWATISVVTKRSAPQIAGPSTTVAPTVQASRSQTSSISPSVLTTPNTTGMSAADAQTTLEAAGFTVVKRVVPSSSSAGKYLGVSCTTDSICYLDYSAGPAASDTQTTTVQAGGARIVLPAGWTLSVYAAGTGGSDHRMWWCINPAGTATPQPPLTTYVTEACTISLVDLGQRSYAGINPNGLLGTPNDVSCVNIHGAGEVGVISDTLDIADTRTFGGRAAEFRKWTHVCEGYTLHGEQYLVQTSPNWDLYSNNAETTYAGATVKSVMASIAQSATLPASTAALWSSDDGVVTAISKVASGWRITIDRFQSCPVDQYVTRNDTTTATTYSVPATATFSDAAKVTVGSKVNITTDGTTVTAVSLLPY